LRSRREWPGRRDTERRDELTDFYMARPGAHEAQLDLLLDYASNVALYPKFQSYFRDRQPPLLAVWGRNDPFLPT
jgi:hypothetical protein